jgi:5-methylcytosine-specific restriction protein B
MPERSRNERRDARLRQLLVELDKHPDGLTWQDLWTRLITVVPVVDEDLETTTTGALKGETDVRWQMTNFDKAGWVLTGQNTLRLTDGGRKALEMFPVPADLQAAATAAYRGWQTLRDEGRAESLEDFRSEGLLPTEAGEPAVYRAAARIFEDGLRHGDSAFAPGRPAWSQATVGELHRAYVENPDLGGDGFETKLKNQLAGCSDDAVLLVAEILALQMLPVGDFKLDNKRGRIKRVLGMMQRPVAMPADINAAMDASVFNGGLTFKTLIWRSLATGIEVAAAWWRLNDAGRERVWGDPWAWRDLVESAEGDTIASARAELRYLRHPEAFLAIISTKHQRLIRETFAEEADVKLSDDLDRDLYAITTELQRRTGKAVNYYAPGIHERWSGKIPTTVLGAETPRSPRRAWLIRGSSVKGLDMIPSWTGDGFVSLAASQLPPITLPIEAAEIRQAVDEGYAHLSYAKREEKHRDISAFLSRMELGDLVLTTSGSRVRVGEISGGATYADSDQALSNLRRPATWAPASAAVDFADLPPELMGRLKAGSDVTDLTDVIALVEGLWTGTTIGTEPAPTPDPAAVISLSKLSDEAAAELLVGREWLDEFVELLSGQRQVILYGPPGTGKTYIAQKVAEAIAPPENIKLVQFHPAFSYEDFFEGYRPVQLDGGQVGFKLKAGPFRRIVEDALEHPNQPYILIIDEINRANLAKVFGELYFLLEYRDSAIDLLYSEDDAKQFQLPKNVFIVGTMNTADRSIALVDAAMRRRFAFLSLHPSDPHMRDVLPAWLQREEMSVEPAELLAILNERIPDRELAIGPSYLMNPGTATDEGIQRIWRTQILPLLGEYHVGEDIDLDKRYGLLALRKELTRRETSEQAEDLGGPGDVEP